MAEEAKKTGWKGPPGSINRAGRKKLDPEAEQKTNRERRGDELMHLLRKLKPLQTRAIQTALRIMENEQANDQNRLKAAVFLSQTYRQLILDTFNKDYDDDLAEEIHEQPNAPVFSLTMIKSEDTETKEE